MTTNAPETPDEGILVRRTRKARVRQWVVAVTSVLAAAFGVIVLTPGNVGVFAYYALLGLMLLNAMIALRQSVHVIYPIETLLRKIRRMERNVDKGDLDIGHFSIHADDAFACLTAGIDNLVSKLSEKARAADERAALNGAMIKAAPFTIYTVSRAGEVYSILKDEYRLVPVLGLEVGRKPSDGNWGGAPNKAKYLDAVKSSFENDGFRWFDLDVGTHHLRGCARSINEMTSVVMLGDLPAIDWNVRMATGSSSKSDFTHQQDALKRFAASIAHDARNVFTALGNLVAVNRTSTDPSVREQVPLAEDAVSRGTRLMTELMQYAGEVRYRLKTTPAAEACRELFRSPTLQAMISDNITLLTDVSSEPMPDIDIDSDQAWKVVINLVKNAVEAIGRTTGRIWLSARPFEMTDEQTSRFRSAGTPPNGPGVMLTVSDDGPGIDSAIILRLFEPYVSSKGTGRGLGLATALSVVDAHNGVIRVDSKLGHGTSFEIFLPASRHTKRELEMISEVAPNGEILLVDDDPTILRTTRLVLQTLKIAAHPAANESDALRKIRTLGTRLNAVLADAHLGGTTSASLIRKIREMNPDLPIILTSGGDEKNVKAAFANAPYDRFLSKPYTIPELSQALGRLKGEG